MTVHIMLDLETWGTRPGCDIRSIGACVFDPTTGYVADATQGGEQFSQSFYIATDNPSDFPFEWNREGEPPRKYALHRDPATEKWWNEPEQSTAAQAFADSVDLKNALVQFTYWLDELCAPVSARPYDGHRIYLWSHGSHFDVPILAEAYHACGLPVPWHYRAPRDTRTLFDAAGITDHSEWLKQHPGPLAQPHHALDDSICQARAVCAAYQRLQVPARVAERLTDQSDEPWPQSSDAVRLHYWRDKAILAARSLRDEQQ